MDLEGSSPQVDWGGNVVYNFTYAYVHMAVKSMFDPYIPNNDGCARPITLKIPEGTVVNCKFPAAVAARMQIGHFMTEIIYRALAKGGSRSGDRERRYAGDDECFLRQKERRKAMAFRDHPRRGHGRQRVNGRP